jgi:hypothetical protein
MRRPRIDYLDRMILIAYEKGEANFNGVNVRNRIKYLKLRRFLANRFINKSKRIEGNDKRF